jgi:dTDP-4-dehydrorhamnose reductase
MKYLIFGRNGWLANKLKDYLGDAIVSDVDILDLPAVRKELEEKNPEVVINAAGITGRPNIDWCEDHKAETIAGNVTAPLNLLQATQEKGFYLVHFGSGCIFQGDNDGKGFKEDDPAEPPSFYSWTKFWTDSILKNFPVLIVRLRLPIDVEPGSRNAIDKVLKYENVIDSENSVTVVPDLLDVTRQLIEKKKTGIYHVTNPGAISPAEIMELYKKIIDPGHEFKVVKVEELYEKGLAKAKRSNTILNTEKLEAEGIYMKPIKERIVEVLEEYKINLNG